MMGNGGIIKRLLREVTGVAPGSKFSGLAPYMTDRADVAPRRKKKAVARRAVQSTSIGPGATGQGVR